MAPQLSDEVLEAVSRSFYLSLRFLPPGMREPVSLGYLIARLGDTFADAPGLEPETRLAWLDGLRDEIRGRTGSLPCGLDELAASISHPGERVLVAKTRDWLAALAGQPAELRAPLDLVLLTILEGQRWDLTAFAGGSAPCRSGEDLMLYTYRVAGCVGEFWTRIGQVSLGPRYADPDALPAMMETGRGLGQALQLVNILRDLHEDLPRGRCYLPADELRAAGWSGSGAPTPEVLDPVFRRWLGICVGLLDDSAAYVRLVRDLRARFCTGLPRLLALETARLLDEAGSARVLRQRVKIPRSAVWTAAARALFC